MKKIISFALAVLIIAVFVCACGKTDNGADREETVQSIEGVWKIENIKFGKEDNPLFVSLANVLNGYLTKAPQIEFKDGSTAQIGDVTVEYIYEGDKLTLTWNQTQSFMLDVTGRDGEMKLDYKKYLSFTLKKI